MAARNRVNAVMFSFSAAVPVVAEDNGPECGAAPSEETAAVVGALPRLLFGGYEAEVGGGRQAVRPGHPQKDLAGLLGLASLQKPAGTARHHSANR